MEIGKEEEIVTVEPVEDPLRKPRPEDEPVKEPVPVRTPETEREEVPA